MNNAKNNCFKCKKFTIKNENKTANPKSGLLYNSTLRLIIQITDNFALALRSKPIT